MTAATATYPLFLIAAFVASQVSYEGATYHAPRLAAGPLRFVPHFRRDTKNYYRDPTRPEYVMAFDAFMDAIQEFPEPYKEVVARELWERHLGVEKTIAPTQVNAIGEAANAPDVDTWHGYTTRRLPEQFTPEIYAALKNMAAQGYRIQQNAVPLNQGMVAERARQDAEASRAAPLGENLKKAIDAANAVPWLGKGKRKLIEIRGSLSRFDNEPGASAFSRVLERVEDPGNETARLQMTPNVKQQVYRNLGNIIKSMAEDPSLRKQIFKDSVGGLGHCNNNVLEVITRLSKLAERHLLLNDIKAGRLSLADFIAKSRQAFRLECLENYVSQHMLTDSTRTAELSGVEPEVALRLKSDLKKSLDLGDSVLDVRVPYWKPKGDDVANARKFVLRAEADSSQLLAFLGADPLWRDGIAAFAEASNPQDSLQLQAFTQYGDFIPVPEAENQVRQASTGVILDNPDAVRLHAAVDRLGDVYKPAGQRIWATKIGEKDTFKTDVEAHQPLHDRIEQMEKRLDSSRTAVAWKMAAHMTPSLVPSTRVSAWRKALYIKPSKPKATFEPALPPDGHFVARLELPESWDTDISELECNGLIAEAFERRQAVKAKKQELQSMEAQRATLLESHPDLQKMSAEEIDHALREIEERRMARARDEDALSVINWDEDVVDNAAEEAAPDPLDTDGLRALTKLQMEQRIAEKAIRDTEARLAEIAT